jgi:hypothetical protein
VIRVAESFGKSADKFSQIGEKEAVAEFRPAEGVGSELLGTGNQFGSSKDGRVLTT